MTGACPGPDEAAGVAHGVLASVGCNAHAVALKAYAVLIGPSSFLPAAITACLTIYVGLLGWGLLTGSSGLRLTEVSKVGLKIGAVLALTLNWTVFQTLVFNVASEAPFEVGRIFADTSSTDDDPLTRLEAIHQELTDSANSLLQPQGASAGAPSPLASAAPQQPPAAQALFAMATTLVVCTVGLIALAMVAQAILVALGPIFILLFLFEQTRGLFIGWVRALTGAIIAPIASWGGLMICLSTLEPWIDKLAQERVAHAIKVETISSLTTFVLTFAGAQVVTALGAIVITTAFTLPRGAKGRDPEPARTSETQQTIVNAGASESRASVLAQSLHSERNPQHGVDGRRTEVFSGADAARAPDAGATVPRLGDSYRRLSPAGALSRAAAPSAGARG